MDILIDILNINVVNLLNGSASLEREISMYLQRGRLMKQTAFLIMIQIIQAQSSFPHT